MAQSRRDECDSDQTRRVSYSEAKAQQDGERVIVLASRSTRRALLLREAGYRFMQLAPPFHDPPQPLACSAGGEAHPPPHVVAMDLALRKAQSLQTLLLKRSASSSPDLSPGVPPDWLSNQGTHPGGEWSLRGDEYHLSQHDVILGADTVVVASDGELLGQPRDQDQARQILRRLIDTTHRVVTAVALVSPTEDRSEVFSDEARVHLGPVADGVLDAYLRSGQWCGKAGGYNLMELQGDWPFFVVDDPTTVIGLPMKKLGEHLSHWPVSPAPHQADPGPTKG